MNKHSGIEKGLSSMVIDDNQGDYILIEDYLFEKFKSINIHQCIDYQTVDEHLKTDGFSCDLILLDLHLPDLSGLELIERIIEQSPKIPIIILTGYADLPLAKKSLELGIYDFLVKDEINPTLLHKSIEFAISRSNYIRQIESQNEKLRNIAWIQSHVVRAPLARMLGIVYMIETFKESSENLPYLLEQLKVSSVELDNIVRNIVRETESLDLKNRLSK